MAEQEDEMRGSLHSGGKSAASGRDDTSLGSESGLQPLPFSSEPKSQAVLRAEGLTKVYTEVSEGAGGLELFRGLDLTVHAGEMVAIVGESGAGKSTLLHLLAALDKPTAGEVYCGEKRLSRFNSRQASEFRNRDVGYVWQFHYLLPEFSALENVAMPLLARGVGREKALDRASYWLIEVGLGARGHHRSGELSGGEQQRVSLARALVTEPRLLLADEPTGDLDTKTGEAVFELIQGLHKAHGLTSVVVTHNLDFAGRCTRMLRLKGGRLEEVTRS